MIGVMNLINKDRILLKDLFNVVNHHNDNQIEFSNQTVDRQRRDFQYEDSV